MGEVTVRDLRNRGGDVLARVERGEAVTVTRHGAPVARLTALPRPQLTATELIRRRRHLPLVDPSLLRADVDTVVDQSL